MAVLGFDDDVWFGLQNAHHHGFAQNNDNNNTNQMLFFTNNNNNIIDNDNYLLLPSSSSSSSSRYEPFSHHLDAQLELQRQEFDYVLHFQNEKLRTALQEQRRHHLTSLMNSLETKASSLIQQKDNDLARATRRGIELQERLRRAETESHTWERIARAKEASVIELNNALHQALRKNDNDEEQNDNDNNNGAEDAESTCFASSEETRRQKWVCRVCKSRSSCVVLLPCKHLCSCKPCESFLGSCPVCESVKETSFEVLLV